MALHETYDTDDSTIPQGMRRFFRRRFREILGLLIVAVFGLCAVALATWSATDPSLNTASAQSPVNLLGLPGAIVADQLLSLLGLAVLPFLFIPFSWAVKLIAQQGLDRIKSRIGYWLAATLVIACFFSSMPQPDNWSVSAGLGGQIGDVFAGGLISLLALLLTAFPATVIIAVATFIAGLALIFKSLEVSRKTLTSVLANSKDLSQSTLSRILHGIADFEVPRIPLPFSKSGAKPVAKAKATSRRDRDGDQEDEPLPILVRGKLRIDDQPADDTDDVAFTAENELEDVAPMPAKKVATPPRKGKARPLGAFELPDLDLLAEPKKMARGSDLSAEQLEENARALEGVLDDFGVKGQIVAVKPGPVVTLYELEPAPGIKSSRVISLADDIARSMSAISARVAVVQGRNAIGIELPNAKRETVYLREMFQTENFINATGHLQVALGKNIGGEPIYADLARMPHLLIAGTTGSGKSVGINTLILSLLYRLSPDRCKLIMIDPKMLELSVYEGIPHLLAPVVTDPKKAVVALKWAVREMEERYKKMSKVGVRNVDGYNTRVAELAAKGEKLTRTIQTGFDPETGEPMFEQEDMDSLPMPYIVVIIDEMADLMMVAGKDIEGAVQRLAQMARAAGIHVIMATQRPSVDVITGTIKANFPTRISFQVTSKIDSRTILGEMGAEQLLGQGDMLYMAGGGRISRLHGPFVSDGEVEAIVKHLKVQGAPDYVDAVTEEADEDYADGAMPAESGGSSGDSLYDQAVAVVLRDKKVSTSYVQRRLQIGYNKAASLIERMEKEGLISGTNAAGKRDILVPGDSARL
jgi:DNA segregation ATPase FtsK/SpoIIIE, S-DNA-T family